MEYDRKIMSTGKSDCPSEITFRKRAKDKAYRKRRDGESTLLEGISNYSEKKHYRYIEEQIADRIGPKKTEHHYAWYKHAERDLRDIRESFTENLSL